MKQWKKLHLTISHLGWVDWISYKPDYWLGAVVVAVPNVSNIMVRFLKRVIFRGAKWYIHVQSPSHFQFFATPWTAAHQASQSPTISWSLPRFKSSALVMPSSHLILWCPLLLLPSIIPSIRVFSNDLALASGGHSIGASASVLPMSIQGWFPLRSTGLISLLSKGLSRVFSSTTVGKHQFSAQPSLWPNSHIHTWPLERPQLCGLCFYH